MLHNETIANVLQTIDVYKGNLKIFRKGINNNDYAPQKCRHYSRTLIWKAFLITGSLKVLSWAKLLESSRVVYHELTKRKDMRVPWWTLDADSPFYQSESMSRKSSTRRSNVRDLTGRSKGIKNLEREKVDSIDSPLSIHVHESSNDEAHQDDMLATVIMDVERLFPGEMFYNAATPMALKIRCSLIEIIYIWSKCNPDVGYKQGFHEIIGLIYMNLHSEAIEIPKTNTMTDNDYEILSLYDKKYLSHDLFTIMNKFLILSGVSTRFFQDEKRLWKSIEQFNVYLMKIDQLIHYNLISKLKILSELWVIRFFRLLLLRELGNDLLVTSLLWDKLAALAGGDDGITALPEVIMFLVVVLLIRIKTELISCDFGEALSLLLHYPIKQQFEAGDYAKFVKNIFKDALDLYDSRNDDRKLYKAGIQLNERANPSLKITMSYRGTVLNGSPRSSGESLTSTSASKSPQSSPQDQRVETLAFEKLRLEMRLKKKAQLMLK